MATQGEETFEEERKDPNFPAGGFLADAQRRVKLHFQFYQFETDSRQSPNGCVPGPLSRACTPNGAGSGGDDRSRKRQRARPIATRVMRRGANQDGILSLSTASPSSSSPVCWQWVLWIKQQSESSSSLHIDLGHWLQHIRSGKRRGCMAECVTEKL